MPRATLTPITLALLTLGAPAFAAEDLAADEDRKSLSVGIRHHF